jgi:hypothetical protein
MLVILATLLTRKVQIGLGKKYDSILKIAKAKRVRDMAQVVDCLPSKFMAYIQISVPQKKKKM